MALFKEITINNPNEREVEPVKAPDIDMSIPWLDESSKPKGLFQEEKLPTITRKIKLVIDADSLVYKAAHIGHRDWVEPTEEEVNSPHGLFIEQKPSMLRNQIDIFNSMVSGIQYDVSEHLKRKGIGVGSALLLFTPKADYRDKHGLEPNFRYKLVNDYNEEEQSLYDEVNSTREPCERFVFKPHPGYKAKRKGAAVPVNVEEIMEYALDKPNAHACDGCEADDIAYMMKVEDPENVVLAVIDKDILGGTPSGDIGHFNFNSRTMVTTTQEEANLFYYRQCMMGDSSDGIPGIYMCGVVKAEQVLPEWVSHEDAWRRVMEYATKKGYTEQYMILQMRLVNLNQVNPHTLITLWEPSVI